jgi:hypothetical protein
MHFGTWPGIKNPFSCSVSHTREDVRESVADAAAICANAPAGVGTASERGPVARILFYAASRARHHLRASCIANTKSVATWPT